MERLLRPPAADPSPVSVFAMHCRPNRDGRDENAGTQRRDRGKLFVGLCSRAGVSGRRVGNPATTQGRAGSKGTASGRQPPRQCRHVRYL
ncbi:MAG: hypothetical protein ACPIOQ_23370, partial [Promethearchaeia archaeon]